MYALATCPREQSAICRILGLSWAGVGSHIMSHTGWDRLLTSRRRDGQRLSKSLVFEEIKVPRQHLGYFRTSRCGQHIGTLIPTAFRTRVVEQRDNSHRRILATQKSERSDKKFDLIGTLPEEFKSQKNDRKDKKNTPSSSL